jgi:hypothetical protein
VAQSTDSIRGKVGYTEGLHIWEIHWPVRQRGTHAVVGVATREAPLHSPGRSYSSHRVKVIQYSAHLVGLILYSPGRGYIVPVLNR